MLRRWIPFVVVAVFAPAASLPAQEEIRVPPQTRINVKDMKEGKKPLDVNQINEAAKLSVMRLTDDVNRGLKSGKTPYPMHKIIQQAGEFILESPYPPRAFDEKQVAYVAAVGKAFMPPLRSVLIPEKDKPLKYDAMVRMNAARMLAVVGKSGHPEVAALALDILSNPKEFDAVKFYALQALKNVFAACDPTNADKSTFTDADLEKRAIKALIDFVQRPLNIPKDSPAEEIEAFHYVRREAIRALGNVRYSVIRKDKTIEMAPAVVLLRYAVGAPALQPAPNLSERAEALIGYLQLAPDREQQMDFAGFYVGIAVRQIVADFNSRKEIPAIAKDGDEKVEAIATPKQADYYTWRLTATKLVEVLKTWKTNWQVNSPRPTPEVDKIMTEVTQQAIDNLLTPLTGTLPKSDIPLGDFNTWLGNQQKNIKSTSLFKDEPNSIIWIEAKS